MTIVGGTAGLPDSARSGDVKERMQAIRGFASLACLDSAYISHALRIRENNASEICRATTKKKTLLVFEI